MALTKIKFRASSVDMKEGTLYYQVIHQRVARQIHTDYRLFPSEWDAERGSVVLPSSASTQRYAYLLSLQKALEADCKKLLLVIAQLEREAKPYTADMVVERFREGKVLHGIVGYILALAERLRTIGKRRMADRFLTTMHSLQHYLDGGDVPLDDVDGTMVQGYEQWMRVRGLCRNTTSFYLRNLRTIYNHAVEEGLVVSSSPFRHVYTGIDRTAKRALPLDMLRRLKALDLSLYPERDMARDLFLFSFYTRGMSFIDMAQLTRRNLQEGVLTYRRQKTQQPLYIKWEAPMQEIVAKYQTPGSPYLLPIVCGEGPVFWRNYKNAYNRISRQLKKIGEMLGLAIPLTTYVARHSWASVAKSKNVGVAVISEGLGHDSERTTRIYLSALDTSVVDRANSLIINSL